MTSRALATDRAISCLEGKDVFELPVVALGPQVEAVGYIDELCSDSHLIACLANAALEDRGQR